MKRWHLQLIRKKIINVELQILKSQLRMSPQLWRDSPVHSLRHRPWCFSWGGKRPQSTEHCNIPDSTSTPADWWHPVCCFSPAPGAASPDSQWGKHDQGLSRCLLDWGQGHDSSCHAALATHQRALGSTWFSPAAPAAPHSASSRSPRPGQAST